MLKTRGGFTLVELLISIVLLGLVGLAMTKVLTSMMRVTTAQLQVAGAQGTSRTGVLAIPQEFREIGFDTLPGAGALDTDLEAIAAHRITFRAMRGAGVVCDANPGYSEFRILKPILGMRGPETTDSFRLFVEGDVNRGIDDQWVSLAVTAIDQNSTCTGGLPAIRLTGSSPFALTAVNFFLGAPLRWYERIEYRPVADPTTGRYYLGARSLSLGQATPLPMIGPLSDSTGFALTYFDGNGTALDPTLAPRTAVRSIGINLTGSTLAPNSLSGSVNRSRASAPVFTRVALRNSLRPSP
jgi:prepilin-type N-terminal cleavage/methylation domain-containing protein